jgi:hypothetical protein
MGRLRVTAPAASEKLAIRLLLAFLCYCPWLLRPMLKLLRRLSVRQYTRALKALAAGVEAATRHTPKPPGASPG